MFSSKPSLLKKARYRLNNSATVLTAKALHRSLAEAVASGDKRVLGKICASVMGHTIMAAIDTRSKNRRYTWELVRYNGSWRNPRMVTQMVVPTTTDGSGPLLRQAVVSISSRQRRTQEVLRNGVWTTIPGSVKEADVTENLAMICLVNPRTWQQGEWRIVGTVPITTAEDWFFEKEMIDKVQQEDAEKLLRAR